MLKNTDKTLLYIIFALFIGGIIILSSASLVISQKNFGTPFYFTLKQLFYGGLAGGILFFATQAVPYRAWKKLAVPLMVLSLVLMAMVFLPKVGYSSGGARRWLQLGFFNFQPSEILKFAFIVYLASWLDARRDELKSFSYGLMPFSVMLGVVTIFFIMQPDIGTLGIIVATALVIFFLGGGKFHQIFFLLAFGLILFYFIIQMAPYRIARILVFLNPQTDPQGIGYQLNQSLIAIGSGGFMGAGFGRSIQKHYIPEPLGDSIFAIFAEEAGFIGSTVLILLFMLFTWKGFQIARKSPDPFGKLLAAGITVGVAIQAFVNIAAISGLLPLTGIPLPFVSYGGTSLVITLAKMGILLNISKHT